MKLQTTDPQAKYNIVDTPALYERIKIALRKHNLNKLLIYGAVGIGKTQGILSLVPKDYQVIVKTLSNETPDNFMLPKYIVENDQDKATDVPKDWLPVYKPTRDTDLDKVLDAKCGKGLLFIDELSRATQQVLNVILPLINENMFNGYRLGSGWTIICASNRPEDDMCGQSDLGNALANRFSIVYYEPTAQSWAEWAKKQDYISPILVDWLQLKDDKFSGGKYFYYDPNEDSDTAITKLMCTPRSWTNACRVLCAYTESTLEGTKILNISQDLIGRAFNECVPKEAVDMFLGYIDIIGKVKDLDKLCRDVWLGKGKNIAKGTLSKIALPLANIIVNSHKDKYPTSEEMLNFSNWLIKLDSDQFYCYCVDAIFNTYGGMLDKENRKNLFILADSYKNQTDEDKKIYDMIFKSFTDKWRFTLDTMPDWWPAGKLLCDEYDDKLSQITIDGKQCF